jgi:ribonuclease BN (tRNA processing enzyme)
VYGPPGTAERVQRLYSALYEKPASEPSPFPLHHEVLTPGATRTVAGVGITPFAVPHVPELACVGYRLEAGGRTIVYSGDSAWTDDFVARARGADLFLCECSTYETAIPIHISYPEIAAQAKALGCRRLVLSHLGREPLAHLAEISLECASDGLTIDL